MKAPPEGTPGRFRLWALAAVIAYLTIEALALGVLAVPRFPIALFVSDYLGLGYAGALGVLASLIVVSVGAEGLILSPMRGAKVLQSAPKVPAPRGIESSSINTLLRDTSQNFVEVFPLKTGVINVYGAISKEEGVEGYRYVVIEPELTPPERKQFDQLKELLIEEMDVDLRSIETREKAEAFLTNKVAQLAQTYGFNIPRPTMRKLQYYFARDFIHLGKIDPLMLDPLIEDISCDGGKIPIYVWHRDYESIPTNVSFDTDQELDTFVSKLAYVSGKHISLAAPMVDASLNDGSRLHLTYGKEITQKGSTFTIRKFRADPFTVVDLIKYNTLNPEVAAYLWYLVEKRLALLVAGGTASGKSVPGSEQVLVYRDGRKQLAQISTLYEEAARGGRTAREGVYDVARPSGWKTAAFGPDLKVGLFDVKSVIRHAAPKSIYRLKTRSGREVSTTGSHSVFTLRDGEVTAFPVSELSPGSFIAVPRVIPEPTEAPGAMDLVDALSPDDGGMYVENVVGHLKRAVDLVGVAETARRLNMSKTSVRLYLSRGFAALRVATFRRLLEITGEHADASALRIRPKTNRQLSVPASLKISKELMRLLGYWVSEGMYQDHGISLFQLSEEVRGDMITTARAVFGADLVPSKGSDPTRLDLQASVVKAVFQRAFKMKGGSGNKTIPDVVLEQRNELLTEFLRAYFTGDAWAKSYVEASTKSRELAARLQYALARFGMVASVRPKVVNGVRYYSVFLYGQTNLRRFAETVGFTSREKQTKLVEYATKPIAPHTNVDTIPSAAALLKGALQFSSGRERKQLWSDWHSYWSGDTQIGRTAMVDFVEASGAQGQLRGRLLDLAYSDIFWDEVYSVEEVPFDEKYVYDLEVPGAQNFVGGTGGVFLHNTTSLNTLSMFITPGQKVISIEDTPELNLPQENWIQEVSRAEGSVGEITLFDLVRNALRQRPDVIIVGEIRGKEAFTLFQAISSVSGDTPVLIRENGGISLRPISAVVDRYYQGASERVPIPVEGPEVLSFDVKGTVQFSPIRYVLRHRASEIYRVRYAGGMVRATGSHSVFVFDENCKVVPKPVSTLEKGDVMVSFVGSNLSRSNPPIDVKSALIDAAGHSIIKSRLKANCPRCGKAETKKAGHISGKQRFWCYSCGRTFVESPALTYVDELGSSGGGMIAFEKSLPLSSQLPLDRHLARVLGIYLADGCVKHKGNSARVVFTLGTPEKSLFVDDLVSFFGRHGSIPVVDDRGTYAIYEFNHSVLAELFESMCGRELTEKRVPDFIWSSTPDVADAFISGWMADGRRTVGPRWSPITSVRPDLVSAISWLARLNGRPTFISERGSKYMSAWVSNFQPRKSSVTIPAKPLRRLAELLGSTGWIHMPKKTARTISKKRAKLALEEALTRKTEPLTWEASQLAATIAALIEGSLVAAPVFSAELLPFDGFVYDLSVPGTEAFFGGDTPAALHNTGHGGLGTIHADSVEAVFNRLTTEPMSLPRSLVGTSLDCIVLQLKLRIGDRSVRRIVSVNEILGYDNRTNEMVMNEVYRWDPVTDRLNSTGRSRLVDKINLRYGLRPDEIRRDIESRKVFLEWLASKNYRSYKEVSQYVQEFYGNPYAMASRARTELEAAAP